MLSWCADVVVSLEHDPNAKAKAICKAAVDAMELEAFYQFPVGPICHNDPTETDLSSLAEMAATVSALVNTGRRVAIHCQAGLHPTGVAIYLLLQAWDLGDGLYNYEGTGILETMGKIRPRMLFELQRKANRRSKMSAETARRRIRSEFKPRADAD